MPGRFLFAVLFVVLTTPASAQEVSQSRFEMPLHVGQTIPYRTVSLKEQGLLVYGNVIADDQNAIEVIRLDTTFRELWRGFIKIDRSMFLINSRFVGDHVFMLLKDRFNPQAEFQVVSLHLDRGNYSIENVKTMIPFVPTHFDVTPSAVLIGGHFNYRPLVLYYSLLLKQSKILPGFFNEPGDLDQMQTDALGNIGIVVSAKNQTRRKSLWIRNYNPMGELVKTIVLQPDEDKNLIFGRSVGTADGNQVVCGVYGRYTEYSRGIFMASIDPYGEYKINYYNFGDLQRFFNYMRANRERRVRDRLERRKVKGKKIRLNYRIMVTDLMPYGDQFIMMGEAFYPHYSYPSSRGVTSLNFSNRFGTATRGDLIFDGYQYTHAVVVGFDKNGTLKWDNSFEINDVRTFQLEQFVKILPQEEKISLLYLFDNTIRSKIIKGADVLEGKSYDPLAMAFRDDIVKERDTQQTKLEYWYGDVFYATGIQSIRNVKDAGVNLTRRVFFINKIDYK